MMGKTMDKCELYMPVSARKWWSTGCSAIQTPLPRGRLEETSWPAVVAPKDTRLWQAGSVSAKMERDECHQEQWLVVHWWKGWGGGYDKKMHMSAIGIRATGFNCWLPLTRSPRCLVQLSIRYRCRDPEGNGGKDMPCANPRSYPPPGFS